MPGLTKRIKIINMRGGDQTTDPPPDDKQKIINDALEKAKEAKLKAIAGKKKIGDAAIKLARALPKGVAQHVFPKVVGVYMKAVNSWLENKKGVMGVNFADPESDVSEQAPILAKRLLKEAHGWSKLVNDPDFQEAVEIVTELVRELLKEEIAPLLQDFNEVAAPKIEKLLTKNIETIEKKGAKMIRTAGDLVNDGIETAFPPIKAVNAAGSIVANMLTAIDVGSKVGLSTLEQYADAQQELLGKESGGPVLSAIRTFKKVRAAKERLSEKINKLTDKLNSGQMTGSVGGRKKTRKTRRKRRRKKRTKKRALKKRH